MKEKQLKILIKEVIKNQSVYAKGYRQAQQNYYDENLLSNFTNYPEDWVNGYKEGLRDARMGKFSDNVLKFLTSIGELGRNVANWTNLGNW